MYVYILGGFLGSGKTTLLMKIASMYIEKGKKVTILVNEMGEIGVDGATLTSGGYNAVELPNGCICCTLSSTLQAAVRDIKKDYDPDVMLIEPTGLALPHKVKEIVHTAMIDPEIMEIIGVMDGPRFEIFKSKREEFLKLQLKYSDMLILNKMDITPKDEEDKILAWAKYEFPGMKVIPVSAKTGMNIDKVFAGLKE